MGREPRAAVRKRGEEATMRTAVVQVIQPAKTTDKLSVALKSIEEAQGITAEKALHDSVGRAAISFQTSH